MRFENKEMKKEIENLFFLIVEKVFFLKIIKYMDWLLWDMKEREVKVYVF